MNIFIWYCTKNIQDRATLLVCERECEWWIFLLAKINNLPNGDGFVEKTVVSSGRMCCGGLMLMFGYRRTCLLFLRYWIWSQVLRPESVSF